LPQDPHYFVPIPSYGDPPAVVRFTTTLGRFTGDFRPLNAFGISTLASYEVGPHLPRSRRSPFQIRDIALLTFAPLESQMGSFLPRLPSPVPLFGKCSPTFPIRSFFLILLFPLLLRIKHSPALFLSDLATATLLLVFFFYVEQVHVTVAVIARQSSSAVPLGQLRSFGYPFSLPPYVFSLTSHLDQPARLLFPSGSSSEAGPHRVIVPCKFLVSQNVFSFPHGRTHTFGLVWKGSCPHFLFSHVFCVPSWSVLFCRRI